MTAPDGAASLSADVATEIRAWMGRLGISQRELARRLGQNGQWVSVRISPRATVPITLDDTQRIAEALGILVRDLLPAYTLERKTSTKTDAATVG
ncbi:helix-turn-helix domain-containing protein [Micromonospora andamanensis]|uniref:HTH cro/C1-type domain-containing protein n=1 Tax=Micromonospora andamanensis TaxID=1287068 RepID=A0ABQ4HYQ1_9ACTN|nr:helix-turn-helix transcriptional regulator [Micromonospora andamanensis]GIJ10770.1 hypothetical protein Van01_39840 [Micromonospora andamanensis]